ncbi:hypothetical protein [Bailinhaonella thermotolerans]|uniref:Uncharacterized protein n=1 Tax=Bailinhaonella thermotolerans TaxID=1070861 RepID=A0A3A4A695_9ACTN|nr:hypothetical protein [Bailinhaonella thermotolerans]RJL21211.1 hypothetical protein D5H75_37730 [Bailinhaonella thermotolerans]
MQPASAARRPDDERHDHLIADNIDLLARLNVLRAGIVEALRVAVPNHVKGLERRLGMPLGDLDEPVLVAYLITLSEAARGLNATLQRRSPGQRGGKGLEATFSEISKATMARSAPGPGGRPRQVAERARPGAEPAGTARRVPPQRPGTAKDARRVPSPSPASHDQADRPEQAGPKGPPPPIPASSGGRHPGSSPARDGDQAGPRTSPAVPGDAGRGRQETARSDRADAQDGPDQTRAPGQSGPEPGPDDARARTRKPRRRGKRRTKPAPAGEGGTPAADSTPSGGPAAAPAGPEPAPPRDALTPGEPAPAAQPIARPARQEKPRAEETRAEETEPGDAAPRTAEADAPTPDGSGHGGSGRGPERAGDGTAAPAGRPASEPASALVPAALPHPQAAAGAGDTDTSPPEDTSPPGDTGSPENAALTGNDERTANTEPTGNTGPTGNGGPGQDGDPPASPAEAARRVLAAPRPVFATDLAEVFGDAARAQQWAKGDGRACVAQVVPAHPRNNPLGDLLVPAETLRDGALRRSWWGRCLEQAWRGPRFYEFAQLLRSVAGGVTWSDMDSFAPHVACLSLASGETIVAVLRTGQHGRRSAVAAVSSLLRAEPRLIYVAVCGTDLVDEVGVLMAQEIAARMWDPASITVIAGHALAARLSHDRPGA